AAFVARAHGGASLAALPIVAAVLAAVHAVRDAAAMARVQEAARLLTVLRPPRGRDLAVAARAHALFDLGLGRSPAAPPGPAAPPPPACCSRATPRRRCPSRAPR